MPESRQIILLTGASGFVGKIVQPILARHYRVIGVINAHPGVGETVQADLLEPAAVEQLLQQYVPDIIIHSAAVRNPDECERDPDRARRMHVDVTQTFADWCRRHGSLLVYISTDYVFDGTHPPYREDAPVAPLNVYGQTKAAGESATRTCPNHIIARIPLQYGFSTLTDDSLLLKVLSALNKHSIHEIEHQQVRYPTLSDDVGSALVALFERRFRGIIHMCGPTRTTRFHIWRAIAEVFDYDPARVLPSMSPAPQSATRPVDCFLLPRRYYRMGLPQFHSLYDGLAFCRQRMEAAGVSIRNI